uniref:Uncharacterized protein n=1 Tax=Anopheles atroparvus TaxID=41427 RepID=A0A182IQ83_ANOAO
LESGIIRFRLVKKPQTNRKQMSAGNDIFGNLDDFLENYDDNYLETSKLSEVENDFDPNRNDNASLSVATSKSKITLEDDGSFNGFGSTSLATGQRMDLTGVNSVIDVDAQPDVITLDSDDESSPLETLCRSANNSFESENYEMRIKIKWGNGIETFTHRKHQKFGDLITKLATKEAADSRSILLNMDDRIIYADDTPDSIGYKTYQFISGRVLRENAPICTQKTTTSSAGSNNILSLKVQLADRKVPLRLQMDKHQTMIVLVIKCAEELK